MTVAFVGVDHGAKTLDVEIARDNFRQLASDQLRLVRLLGTLGSLDVLPVGAPDGIPDLDPTQIHYMGVSFGAVAGASVLALAPEIRSATVSVGGASLGSILRDSQTIQLLVEIMFPDGASNADFVRYVAMAQGIIDAGDPVNFAPFVARRPLPGVPGWRGTDVLVQEISNDKIIPNSATRMLTRALGGVQVEPVIESVPGLSVVPAPAVAGAEGALVALSQFDRAGGAPADHRGFWLTEEARRQYVAFFRSALAGPRATITSSYP